MSYAQVLDTMFKLSLAMLLGFVLNKTKVIHAETNKSLSGLIINVTCPALVVYAVCDQQSMNAEALKLVGFGAALYLLMPLIALGLSRLLRVEPQQRGVYQLLMVFGNVTFMGFPVVQALYGAQAIFYMNILNILFTVLIFTYGVRLLESKVGVRASLKLSDVLSPGTLAGLLSLLIYFLQIRVPGLIVNALGFIGGITTPLSMMVIGSMIAGFSFGQVFAQRKLFLLSALKLLAFPLAGFLVARWLFQDPMLVGIITISLAMPSASLCAMVSRQYGSELQGDVAALGVFLTTLLSIVTIPLVTFVLM